MKNLSKHDSESLTEFANRLAIEFNKQNTKSRKKGIGQFFTPPPVADFMAQLANIQKDTISILDPGAGIGILSASLIDNLKSKGKVKKINLVCYETDERVLPYLRLFLREVKKDLHNEVHLEYKIIKNDFVKSNADRFISNPDKVSDKELFDVIISNPPYFKLNKQNLPKNKFRDIISGQPNIYSLFMAVSVRLLNSNGEMIFITPRSFCSGLYYNKFRKWLVGKVNIEAIHLFHSRKEIFAVENVLQENIITKFIKKRVDKISISKSLNGDFSKIKKIYVSESDVIYKTNGHLFFRIPSNEEELKTVRELDKLPNNFYKLGIKISTGRVVAFRNRKYLQNTLTKDSFPLFWMHNIRNGRIVWPIPNKNKPLAIKNTVESNWLLLEAGNYVVMKRFTAKEQKKRFVTACILKEDFEKYGYFALDNMINYIYGKDKPLSKNQARGIAKYMDLPIVDLYFRVLNGHTQVNANEVYALPFPSLEQLELFGKDNSEDIGLLTIKNKELNQELADKQTLKPIET